jgi:hypothetical protein
MKMKQALEKTWYRAGARFSAAFLGTGTYGERIRGSLITLALSAGAFALSFWETSSAWAVTDLNGAASNLQTGFQSAGRALYYGIGATGLAVTAGGINHARKAAASNGGHGSVGAGLAAAGAGAAMTGIGTYMAFFNQTAMQDTGGMSTNAMGIPQ